MIYIIGTIFLVNVRGDCFVGHYVVMKEQVKYNNELYSRVMEESEIEALNEMNWTYISYNAFAAEIIAHAIMADNDILKELFGELYFYSAKSALKADLGVNDIADYSKGERFYAEEDALLVEQQRGIFGDY